MTKYSFPAVALAVAASAAVLLPASVEARSAYDGRWSVIIQTTAGSCDAAYRYSLNIVNGNVTYDGDGSFDIRGRVVGNGSVRVRVSRGSSYADGTGRLGGSSGSGMWRGVGGSSACSGRWFAERRR